MKPIAQIFCICSAIFCLSALMGCNSENDEFKSFAKDEAPDEDAHGDDHEHKAPHGGELYEVGEHAYHVEVVCDDEHHMLTIYILDGHAENAHAIDQTELTLTATINDKPAEFKLAAATGGQSEDGKCSQFELASEELVEFLHENEDATAQLKVTIGGKEHTVTLSHHDHEEHEQHEHEKEHQGDSHDKDGPEHDSKKEEAKEPDKQ